MLLFNVGTRHDNINKTKKDLVQDRSQVLLYKTLKILLMLWKFTKYSLNKTTQNATKSNQYYQSMQFNLQKLQKLQMQHHLKKIDFHYLIPK